MNIGDVLSYTTLNNYVSALNTLGRFYDGSFDLRQDFGIILLLRGYKHLKGDASIAKDPLLPSDLKLLCNQVDHSDNAQSLVWIIVLLAFRTLLRKSHFVSTGIDDQEHLLWVQDVTFESWGCKITVNSSKTIQFSQRSFEIPISYCSPPLCAASLLKSYMDSHPKHKSEYLFTLRKNGISKPVPYTLSLDFLKTWVKQAGITKDVGFHSLRRGAATFMHLLHIDLISIQQAGDWLSLCVLKYLASDSKERG